MGLVAGVDYRPLQGRLQADLLLEEVGPLRELELDVAPIPVGQLAADLARSGEYLPGHEVRGGVLDDPAEWGGSVHQVVLMTAVAVALAIRVVLVYDEFLVLG